MKDNYVEFTCKVPLDGIELSKLIKENGDLTDLYIFIEQKVSAEGVDQFSNDFRLSVNVGTANL